MFQDPPLSRLQQQVATVSQPSQQGRSLTVQRPAPENRPWQCAEAREPQPSSLPSMQGVKQPAAQSGMHMCSDTTQAAVAARSEKPLSENWRHDYHRWYLESCDELERRAATDNASEDYCFVCKDGGDLIECDYGRGSFPETSHGSPCYKVYHLECVGLEKVPEDTAPWLCPRHRCKHPGCDATVDSHRLHTCKSCPTTFCRLHCAATGAKTLPEQPEDNNCVQMKCDDCQALEDAQNIESTDTQVEQDSRSEPANVPLQSHAATTESLPPTEAIGVTRSWKHMPQAIAPCVLGTVPTARATSVAEAQSILHARQVLLSILGDIPPMPNSSGQHVPSEVAIANSADPPTGLQPLNIYGMDSWHHCLDSPGHSAAQQPAHKSLEAAGTNAVTNSGIVQALKFGNNLGEQHHATVQPQRLAGMKTWQECLESVRYTDAQDALAIKHAVSKAIELAHSNNCLDVVAQLEFALSDKIFKPTSASWTKQLALRMLERSRPVNLRQV
eukprot:jgi/Chlat1/677/Chrsp104S08605